MNRRDYIELSERLGITYDILEFVSSNTHYYSEDVRLRFGRLKELIGVEMDYFWDKSLNTNERKKVYEPYGKG